MHTISPHVCHGFFFFKQKPAYEMRISDWSSDVCPSDLFLMNLLVFRQHPQLAVEMPRVASYSQPDTFEPHTAFPGLAKAEGRIDDAALRGREALGPRIGRWPQPTSLAGPACALVPVPGRAPGAAPDFRGPTSAARRCRTDGGRG